MGIAGGGGMSLVAMSGDIIGSRPPSRLYSLLLGLRLLDHLAGEVPRNLLVAEELHRELTLAAGDRAKIRRVGENLGHRHLGLDLGHAGPDRLHPERAPPPRVQIAD